MTFIPARSPFRTVALGGPWGPTLRRTKRAFDSRVVKRGRDEDVRIITVLAALLGSTDWLLDLGANRGTIVREAVRIAPFGGHVAVEPLPELAAKLRSTLPSITVLECAAGAEAGQATFYRDVDAPTRSSLAHESGTEALEVRITTVDAIVANAPSAPRVIKLDVEGAEFAALQGARETLRRDRPVILFECDRQWTGRFGNAPGDVHDLLVRDADYRIFDMDGNGPLLRQNFDEIAGTTHRNARWNFVATWHAPSHGRA